MSFPDLARRFFSFINYMSRRFLECHTDIVVICSEVILLE